MRVVVEDGYVKVVHRDGRTICAAVDNKTFTLRGIEFPDEADRRNNRTRQSAMRALKAAGYR